MEANVTIKNTPQSSGKNMIDRARTAKELLVKEAIYIRVNHPFLNIDGGLNCLDAGRLH